MNCIRIKKIIFLFFGAAIFAGCAGEARNLEVTQQQDATIRALNLEVKRLNEELDRLVKGRDVLIKIQDQLNQEMRREMERHDLSVQLAPRGLVVMLPDRTLFQPGEAVLKPAARSTLGRIAQILGNSAKGRRFYIEGHTDSDPIRLSKWRSNWELSSARALEVLHFLSEDAGLDPRLLAATGYGEFQPVSEMMTAEEKARNRRVEILIV